MEPQRLVPTALMSNQTEERPAWSSLPPVAAGLAEYPELDLVLSVAVDSVLRAFGLEETADHDVVLHARKAAREAVLDIYGPMATKARALAQTAEDARLAKVAAVAETATAMAAESAAVAVALAARGEESAREIATEASETADRVAAEVAPGDEIPAAAAAADTSLAVQQAAAQSASQRTRAEEIVSHSVRIAVSTVAAAADAAATAAELDVLNAALTVEAFAFDACYQAAIDAATSTVTSELPKTV